MGRRIDAASDPDGLAALLVKVRAHLIQRCEESIVSISQNLDSYDFTHERDRQLDRLADLKAGKPTNWYGWQLPADAQPVNRAKLYEVSSTGITPAVVERW